MLSIKNYNLLILGRSGAGKSATTKLLTNCPSVKVANSLKQVTTQVNYYQGSAFEINGQQVRFCILDIPGLDKINNRAVIRQKILSTLEQHNISLNGIIYVSSLTERDTLDQQKLFRFIQQLPWNNQQKKNCLIPILTKYDNLVIDSQQDEIQQIEKEYQQIFTKADFGQAWNKRIEWINQTKSLQFKLKSYEMIRDKFQKQIERLYQHISKCKITLTARAIRQSIDMQDKYIIKKLFGQFQNAAIPFKKQKKEHSILVKIQVEPHTIQDSMTAVSATSIGLIISKFCQKEVSTGYSIVLLGIPIVVALLKLASESTNFKEKKIIQANSGQSIIQSYERICSTINKQLEAEWSSMNSLLEFFTIEKKLYCRLPRFNSYKFIDLSDIRARCEGVYFERQILEGHIQFSSSIPSFKDSTLWSPEVVVEYGVKKFREEDVLERIEGIRGSFYCRQ